MIYRFADCALDTQLYTLQRAGQSTRLAPKVFEVLCYLIAHRDRVVSKQELCEQVWEGLAISDATLESCLRAVRLTVGDSGQAQRIIQTQRGYGYRFVADLEPYFLMSPPPPLPPEAASPHCHRPQGRQAADHARPANIPIRGRHLLCGVWDALAPTLCPLWTGYPSAGGVLHGLWAASCRSRLLQALLPPRPRLPSYLRPS